MDITGVPPGKARVSQNVQFLPGQTGTRLGFSTAFATTDSILAMFNWISSLGNLLLWYRTSDRSVRLMTITNPGAGAATVIPGDLIGEAATFSEAGARLYLAFFHTDEQGEGASGCRVLTYQGSSFVSDLAFLPPITYVPPAPTEPGPGNVTAGLHWLGYRIEYRSGFITRPSPDSGVGTIPSTATFNPISFTASGNTYLSWTLTTAWPTEAIGVRAIMTPVSNPAQWFYISTDVESVVGGTTSSITFTINVADEILFAEGQDVTPSLSLLTNSVSNVPQFLPSITFTHGDRMVYVTHIVNSVGKLSDALFVSDIAAYQDIAPDLNLIQLPGLKDIVTGCSLDGTLFIFGPQWTYRTIDNNGSPSSWPTPILVDGRRGTLSIRGVEVAPSGTYAWVASQDGLYFFQGVYPALPISYYQQPDWDRINWNFAGLVQVKDDPSVKKVYVLAPLDDNTAPSHMLTWDYTNGFTPDTVQYSLDFLQSYSLGAIEVVKNGLPAQVTAASQKKELWTGSAATDGILRRNCAQDTDPFLDNGYLIFGEYETGLFPKEGTPGEVFQHHAANMRITGNGTLQATTYALDHAQSEDLLLIDLSTAPGQVLFRGMDMISEGVTYLFSQGANLVQDSSFEGT